MTGKHSGEHLARHTFNIFVPYDPPNWNEYIRMERTNKHIANGLKQDEKELMGWYFNGWRYTGGYPAQVTIRPHFKSKRADLDNTRYKGLLDGLVSCGVIENDNLTKIQRIVLEPVFEDVDCSPLGIDITIEPLGE